MLRRESQFVLSASYTFAEPSDLKRRPLWASVRAELVWARSLLPFIVGDVRKKRAPTVAAYDASPRGHGIVEAEGPAAEIVAHGRL